MGRIPGRSHHQAPIAARVSAFLRSSEFGSDATSPIDVDGRHGADGAGAERVWSLVFFPISDVRLSQMNFSREGREVGSGTGSTAWGLRS